MKPKTAKRLIAAAIIAGVFAVGAILRWSCVPQYAIGDYEITDLGFIIGYGHADAINNEGHVVGWTRPSEPGTQSTAFIWSPEKGRRSIPALEGKKESLANDINDKGQVVGWFSEPDQRTPHRAFIWDEETGITELGTLGGKASRALAVSNKGQVVGYSRTSNGQWHAFIWDKTNGMRDIGTLGGESCAMDINEKGQVVGISYLPNGQEHAFLWEQDTGMVDLGTLGGPASRATSINNSGQVGGESSKKRSGGGFIWELNTGMTDLGIKDRISWGMKINDSGQAVGHFYTPKFLFFKERHSIMLYDPNHGIAELNLGLENASFVSTLDINNKGQVLATYQISPQKYRMVILTPKTKSKPKNE